MFSSGFDVEFARLRPHVSQPAFEWFSGDVFLRGSRCGVRSSSLTGKSTNVWSFVRPAEVCGWKGKRENEEKKAHKDLHTLWIYQKMCLPCLIIVQSCYFVHGINKPFTCSCCVICVACSVHVISTYYMRKGSWVFYLNYPEIKGVRKSDHMVHFKNASRLRSCAYQATTAYECKQYCFAITHVAYLFLSICIFINIWYKKKLRSKHKCSWQLCRGILTWVKYAAFSISVAPRYSNSRVFFLYASVFVHFAVTKS